MSRLAFGPTRAVPALFLLAVLLTMTGCSEIAPEVVEEAKSAQKDFLLGPEDVLEIAVWRNQDLTQKEEIIRPDGKISMPLLGEVVASGKTANQLASHITERLKVFKESPSVTVRVKEVNSYYVYVLGEVMKPGKYKLKSHATVLQSIAVAGGFTTYASKNKMQVLRTVTSEDGKSREVRIPARYSDLVDGSGELGNFLLKTGDVVIVP
jgi:polysaccharide export outer membrane protein